jgi:AcrR family transcriptional regulator
LRADAQRNRTRLLEAAEEVFTTKGTSASTEEVARTAGVGIGTLFRHFPTKEALLEAVLMTRLERIADEAIKLSEVDDPGRALHTFFHRVIVASPTKKALAEALAEAGVDVGGATREAGRKLAAALDPLLRRAQDADAVRRDLGVPDLVALLVGAGHAIEQVGPDRQAQKRVIAVILNGLRPDRP